MIWLAFAACLVISFMFSGIESGVLSVNRVRLRHFARRGEDAAVQLDSLLSRIERLVTTVVIVTNTANVVALTILYTKFTRWLGAEAGAIASLAVALPLFVFALEFLPKAIFRRFPYRTLVIFARILAAVSAVFSPLMSFGAWIVRPLFRAGREDVSGRIVSIEDLKRVAAESAAKGQLSETERQIIDHVVDYRLLHSIDVMDPIVDSPKVSPETYVSDLLEKSGGGSRYLVVDDDGRVQGLVRVADLLFDGVKSGRVQSYARRMAVVSHRETAMSSLRKLRAARLPVALVTADDGRPLGTVTSERLVRQLFGGGKKSVAPR